VNTILHPLRTLATLLTAGRAVYLAAMLAPLAFLPLLGGWDLLGVLPGLAQNLLGQDRCSTGSGPSTSPSSCPS